MPVVNNVPNQAVRAVFEEAAEIVKSSTTNNVVISDAELAAKLDTIDDKRVKLLAQMLYNYAGHLDSDHLTRTDEIDAALAKHLDRLVDGRDINRDGNLSNDEARSLSKMGRIAFGIAKSRIDGPIDPGPPRFDPMVDRAIAAGVVSVEMDGNNIIGVKVDENYGDGGLPGEPELLAMVLDLPQAKGIQKINIGYIEEWDGDDTYEEAISVIAARGPMENLKDLFVGDFTQDQTEISWVDLGNVAALFSAAPNLTDVKLRGAGIDLASLAHDDLETLTIETGGLPGETMAAIGDAKLPKLKDLEVWFGDEEYGFDGQFQTLMNLLEGNDRPQLKRLALKNADFTDDIVPMLVRGDVMAQLEHLDLSMGTLTDAGAQVLIQHADELQHLSSINVDRNFLSDATIDALEAAFPTTTVSAARQKEDYGDGTYVSVGE